MEQLAFFVTKSFEYSNTTNRVLEIIKMTTKFDDENLEKSDEKNEDSVNSMDEDESVDIEITDNSDVKSEICDKSSDRTAIESESPLPLIKKFRDGSKHVTKNWLISDCPKKKDTPPPTIQENQENSNIIRVENLVAKKPLSVRAKPVNELLKQIREINNQSPLHDSLKVEIEDVKTTTGKSKIFSPRRRELIKFN
jgi:hypothetical protein